MSKKWEAVHKSRRGIRTRRGAELGKRVSVCGAARMARSTKDTLLRQFVCVPVVLKAFDGAIVFKPHIVKVSLAGHGVGRADGVRSCGLDGYLAVGR